MFLAIIKWGVVGVMFFVVLFVITIIYIGYYRQPIKVQIIGYIGIIGILYCGYFLIKEFLQSIKK